MKSLIITILLLFFACNTFGQKTGYIVATFPEWGKKPSVKKTQNVELVNRIVNNYFVDLNFKVENEMKKTNRFIIQTDQKTVYVERKRINKKGKYRRFKL